MRMQAVKRAGALAVAAGMVLASAGPALAEGPTSTATPPPRPRPALQAPTPGEAAPAARIDRVQQQCEAAIDRRIATLATLKTTVSTNTNLAGSDRAALLAQIAAENDGLGALRTRIAGDTDLAILKADCKDIVGDFRVYLLMAPKVRLVIAAATAGQMGQKVDGLAAKLQAAIDGARSAGKDVTAAQQDLDAMKAAAVAGVAAASPVPGLVLTLRPQDYPGDLQALQQARQDVKAARDHFVEARADARRVIADLKALKTPETPQTPTSMAG